MGRVGGSGADRRIGAVGAGVRRRCGVPRRRPGASRDGRGSASGGQSGGRSTELGNGSVRVGGCRRARAADAALIPPEQVAERVMAYERHLHAQLASTLRELERLLARRGGLLVAPGVVADVQLAASPGPG